MVLLAFPETRSTKTSLRYPMSQSIALRHAGSIVLNRARLSRYRQARHMDQAESYLKGMGCARNSWRQIRILLRTESRPLANRSERFRCQRAASSFAPQHQGEPQALEHHCTRTESSPPSTAL